MRTVFLDTGYFVARLNPNDKHHARALWVADQLLGARCVTSDLVLVELLNWASKRSVNVRKACATIALEFLNGNPDECVPADRASIVRAIEACRDSPASRKTRPGATDAHAMEAMDRRGITVAASFDRHFERPGIRVLAP